MQSQAVEKNNGSVEGAGAHPVSGNGGKGWPIGWGKTRPNERGRDEEEGR